MSVFDWIEDNPLQAAGTAVAVLSDEERARLDRRVPEVAKLIESHCLVADYDQAVQWAIRLLEAAVEHDQIEDDGTFEFEFPRSMTKNGQPFIGRF